MSQATQTIRQKLATRPHLAQWCQATKDLFNTIAAFYFDVLQSASSRARSQRHRGSHRPRTAHPCDSEKPPSSHASLGGHRRCPCFLPPRHHSCSLRLCSLIFQAPFQMACAESESRGEKESLSQAASGASSSMAPSSYVVCRDVQRAQGWHAPAQGVDGFVLGLDQMPGRGAQTSGRLGGRFPCAGREGRHLVAAYPDHQTVRKSWSSRRTTALL